MPKKVMSNMLEGKFLADGVEVEDIQSVTLPDVTNTTSDLDPMGVIGKLTVPDMSHFEKMTLSIEHNRGLNWQRLRSGNVVNLEFRIVMHRYDVAGSELGYKRETYRVKVLRTNGKDGSIKRGDPRTTTEEYSVLRYEVEEDGEIVTLVDIPAGKALINGVDVVDEITSLLN